MTAMTVSVKDDLNFAISVAVGSTIVGARSLLKQYTDGV
jgi:hypothetical protein